MEQKKIWLIALIGIILMNLNFVSALILPTSADFCYGFTNCEYGGDGDINTKAEILDVCSNIYNYTFIEGIPINLTITALLDVRFYSYSKNLEFYCFNSSNSWEIFKIWNWSSDTYFSITRAIIPNSCKINNNQVNVKLFNPIEQGFYLMDIFFSDISLPITATNYKCLGEGFDIINCEYGGDGDFNTYTYSGDSSWYYNYTFLEGLGQKVEFYTYVEGFVGYRIVYCYNQTDYVQLYYNDTYSEGWNMGEIPDECLNENIVTFKTIDNGGGSKHFHDTFFRGEAISVSEEERFSATGQAIYDILDSSGAGLGMFLVFIGQSIPILLIGLMIVGIIIAVGYGLVKIFKWRR